MRSQLSLRPSKHNKQSKHRGGQIRSSLHSSTASCCSESVQSKGGAGHPPARLFFLPLATPRKSNFSPGRALLLFSQNLPSFEPGKKRRMSSKAPVPETVLKARKQSAKTAEERSAARKEVKAVSGSSQQDGSQQPAASRRHFSTLRGLSGRIKTISIPKLLSESGEEQTTFYTIFRE